MLVRRWGMRKESELGFCKEIWGEFFMERECVLFGCGVWFLLIGIICLMKICNLCWIVICFDEVGIGFIGGELFFRKVLVVVVKWGEVIEWNMKCLR